MEFQLVYLNGPSSAGKSTLAKILQEKLDTPFLHIGIDTLISLMPEKSNDWAGSRPSAPGFRFSLSQDAEGRPRRHLQVGPLGKAIDAAYAEIVALLARLGHHVIVDDVALEETELFRWKTILKEYRTLYVGVQATLLDLEEREARRGDRPIGSARVQLEKIQFLGYDLLVNTSTETLAECAEKIAIALAPKQVPTKPKENS